MRRDVPPSHTITRRARSDGELRPHLQTSPVLTKPATFLCLRGIGTDMPTKNRSKNTNSNEKSLANHQDDVAKKSPKVSKTDNTPVSSSKSGSGKFPKFLSALCYFVLVGGAGFASFYLQHALTEVKQISLRHEESIQKNADMGQKVERALQQVSAISSSVENLEATVGRTQAVLEDTNRAVRKGEVETRRVEEVLQKLQNEILRDLSEGIREVKEAREHDFSSLERTLEERLAELSRSIADSVAEFTEAQGEAQAQLGELRTKMEEHSEPGLLKHELLSITTAVADLHTASEVAEGNMGVLREQITSVGAELQTRNKEVASLSEEIEAVRSLVQSTAGQLRQEVSTALVNVQAMSEQVRSIRDGQDQARESLQSLQMELGGELAKNEKRGDDLEARLKTAEDDTREQASSAAEQASRFEALLSKYDSHESILAAQAQAAEKVKQALKDEVDDLRSSLGDLQASVATLEDLNHRLQAVEQRRDVQEAGEASVEAVLRAELEELYAQEESDSAVEREEEVHEEEAEEEITRGEEAAEEEPVAEELVEDEEVTEEEVLEEVEGE